MNTKAALKQNGNALDRLDCSSTGNASTIERGGYVSRLTIARKKQIKEGSKTSEEDTELSHPRIDYLKDCKEKDLSPDTSLLDHISSDQHNEMSAGINKMIHTAVENGFPDSKPSELQNVNALHANIFRVSFSSGLPAQAAPLQIDLISDAVPIRVRVRKYSQEQHEFMQKMVSNLIKCKMLYPNPTSP